MTNIALGGTWHVHFGGYANEIAADKRCHITVLWDDNEENGRAAGVLAEREGELCSNGGGDRWQEREGGGGGWVRGGTVG